MRSSRPHQEGEQLLTLADIARHFNLPESTARYYCKRFAAFMPSQGEGRRRRYRQESLSVVAAILEHMRTARTASGVESVLSSLFPCTTEAVVPVHREMNPHVAQRMGMNQELDMLPSLALKVLEQQSRTMEGIAASLHILAQRQEELHRLSELARTASQENASLRQEVLNLRTLLHSSEKIHQDDLDQIRTWVGRIARKRSEAENQQP